MEIREAIARFAISHKHTKSPFSSNCCWKRTIRLQSMKLECLWLSYLIYPALPKPDLLCYFYKTHALSFHSLLSVYSNSNRWHTLISAESNQNATSLLETRHRHVQPSAACSLSFIPFYFAISAQVHTVVIPHKSGQNEWHRVGRSWNTHGHA